MDVRMDGWMGEDDVMVVMTTTALMLQLMIPELDQRGPIDGRSPQIGLDICDATSGAIPTARTATGCS